MMPDIPSKKGRDEMAGNYRIRRGWLKLMYLYTILGSGGIALGIILIPNTVRSVFGWPDQDPVMFGILGSIYLAFGILSIGGLKSPVKFSPILMLQLVYKVIWFLGIFIPMLIAGTFPSYGIVFVLIFASYIIGDLIAIPFPYIFMKGAEE